MHGIWSDGGQRLHVDVTDIISNKILQQIANVGYIVRSTETLMQVCQNHAVIAQYADQIMAILAASQRHKRIRGRRDCELEDQKECPMFIAWSNYNAKKPIN